MKRIINIAVLLMILSIIFMSPSFAAEEYEMVPEENHIIDTAKNYVALENCEGEYIFSDPEEVRLIAKQYSLEDASNIAEIRYVPIITTAEMNIMDSDEVIAETPTDSPKRAAGTTYYIKKKKTSESRGYLIRSSWYRYPGGEMTISESVSRGYTYSLEAGISVSSDTVESALKSSYGMSLTKSDTVSDKQTVSVQKYCKRNVKAYVNKRTYSGELWKKWYRKGELVDTKCGTTKVTRGVGVIFAIGKNESL